MSDVTNDAELGRSKQSVSPYDHLQHLLNIGWDPESPLIQRFVRERGLKREFEELLKGRAQQA